MVLVPQRKHQHHSELRNYVRLLFKQFRALPLEHALAIIPGLMTIIIRKIIAGHKFLLKISRLCMQRIVDRSQANTSGINWTRYRTESTHITRRLEHHNHVTVHIRFSAHAALIRVCPVYRKKVEFRNILKYIQILEFRIQGDGKNIFILGGSGHRDKMHNISSREKLEPQRGVVAVTYGNDDPVFTIAKDILVFVELKVNDVCDKE